MNALWLGDSNGEEAFDLEMHVFQSSVHKPWDWPMTGSVPPLHPLFSMKKLIFSQAMIAAALCAAGHGALMIDFNSNQNFGGTPTTGDPDNPATPAHNQSGYQSYHVNHEDPAQLNPASAGVYNVTYSVTGAGVTTVTPDWTNTTGNGVRQSIGRSDGEAGTWIGDKQSLLRDWIGIDSRSGSGGNSSGSPTYMTLTLGGLAAAEYSMRTYHHDVEQMNSLFTVEISTDGGSTYGSIINGRMTNSEAGGTPAGNEVPAGSGVNVIGGDPALLSSTMNLSFTATGSDDVVIRFAVDHPGSDSDVHQTFFGINGFELDQVPEPSSALLAFLGMGLLVRRRR